MAYIEDNVYSVKDIVKAWKKMDKTKQKKK